MPDEPDRRDIVDKLEDAGLSHDEALAEVRRMHDEQLARNGWVAHLVMDDPESPTGFNACTCGVLESFGHPDFQVIQTMAPGVAGAILAGLVDAVKAGARFSSGTGYCRLADDLFVGFADATEGGRPVLRIILPDAQGRVAWGEIDPAFAWQYDGTR